MTHKFLQLKTNETKYSKKAVCATLIRLMMYVSFSLVFLGGCIHSTVKEENTPDPVVLHESDFLPISTETQNLNKEIKGLNIIIFQEKPILELTEIAVDESDIEWIEFSFDRITWYRVLALEAVCSPSEDIDSTCCVRTSDYSEMGATLHIRYQDKEGQLKKIFSTDDYPNNSGETP